MLSGVELARKLNMPVARIRRLVESGELAGELRETSPFILVDEEAAREFERREREAPLPAPESQYVPELPPPPTEELWTVAQTTRFTGLQGSQIASRAAKGIFRFDLPTGKIKAAGVRKYLAEKGTEPPRVPIMTMAAAMGFYRAKMMEEAHKNPERFQAFQDAESGRWYVPRKVYDREVAINRSSREARQSVGQD